MNTLSIIGSLIKKNDAENIQNKEGKKWIKQTFLIDTGNEYNSQICFQLFVEEKIKILEDHNIGDKIEVFFNISSKEYKNRYYHNIDAWRITKVSEENINDSNSNDEMTEPLPF